MKKRKKDKFPPVDYKDKFKETIVNNHKSIWTPKTNVTMETKYTNAWFDIKKYTNKSATKHKLNQNYFNNIAGNQNIYTCKKIILDLDNTQKKIIDRWFDSYILMYNATLKYIKTQIFENRNNSDFDLIKLLKYRDLRTKFLKDIKNAIIENSQLPNHNKNTKIKCHMLDGAIQLACANYKSAISNFKNGTIKRFRVRYWSLKKNLKMLDIEKQYFKKETFCYKELGDVNCIYDCETYKLNDIRSACKIHYDSDTDRYKLLIPEKTEIIKTKHEKKVISLDPGLRKFLTGLSENEYIIICSNGIESIKEKLEKIDEVENNNNIPNKKKRKSIKRINRKISDMVDDLHWKVIKYLTDKYETIMIGDMSVKGIVSNETSNIQKMMKRIAYKFKFYQFKQRLIYKCKRKGNKYKEVDERYTSKTCSVCGSYDQELGAKKIYKCKKCGTKIDRDINGCRGIYIKQFM